MVGVKLIINNRKMDKKESSKAVRVVMKIALKEKRKTGRPKKKCLDIIENDC